MKNNIDNLEGVQSAVSVSVSPPNWGLGGKLRPAKEIEMDTKWAITPGYHI